MFAKRTNEGGFLFALRWTARLLSIVTIGFLLLFMFGEEGDLTKLRLRDLWGFAFFPVGLMVGLILGWKRELAGGIVAVGSILLFYLIFGWIINGTLSLGPWFLVFGIGGILYLAYAVAARERWNGDVTDAAGNVITTE